MSEIYKPEATTYWVITSADEQIVHEGQTLPNQVTSSGQPMMRQTTNENEHLGNLDSVVASFDPLPAQGTPLTKGEIYSHNGSAVMVRQSHTRTEHAPADVPALFLIHRVSDDIEWIAGEQVNIGNERTYSGSTYKVIQSHVTQDGWEPPNVPALWSLVVAPSTQWQAGVAYAIDDEVEYNSAMYRCRQAHTAQVGWEPPNVLALWLPI